MADCDILLSVCGEVPYLPQFLESVRGQRGCGWRLVYRFDGEPTAEAVRLLARVEGSVELPGREHLGVVGSYRRLIGSSTADRFCLADQDDVWHAEKISVLKTAMDDAEGEYGRDIPLVVHSDMRVVDEKGVEISPSFVRYQSLDPSRNSLRDLLVQNNVTGCALMGNRALRETLGDIPDAAICHDWYLALVAAAFGRIVFTDRALVDYRQHGGNVYGAVRRRRLLRTVGARTGLHDRMSMTQRQATAFLAQYGGRLPRPLRDMVSAWTSLLDTPSYFSRLKTVLRFGFRKNDWIRTFGMLWAL